LPAQENGLDLIAPLEEDLGVIKDLVQIAKPLEE
jgi:hypothetical protein